MANNPEPAFVRTWRVKLEWHYENNDTQNETIHKNWSYFLARLHTCIVSQRWFIYILQFFSPFLSFPFFLSFFFSRVWSNTAIVGDRVHVHRGEFERNGYLDSNRSTGAALSIRSVDVCTSRAISTKWPGNNGPVSVTSHALDRSDELSRHGRPDESEITTRAAKWIGRNCIFLSPILPFSFPSLFSSHYSLSLSLFFWTCTS